MPQHGRGDHRRQSGTGDQSAPHRLSRGCETHEADARAALLFVEMQIEHADADEIGEEVGKSRIFGVDVRVDVVERDALGAEVVEKLCEFIQVVDDDDRFQNGAPIEYTKRVQCYISINDGLRQGIGELNANKGIANGRKATNKSRNSVQK